MKSEDVPKEQGPVTTVVGKTFEKIVTDPTKDVLIEFYAPYDHILPLSYMPLC